MTIRRFDGWNSYHFGRALWVPVAGLLVVLGVPVVAQVRLIQEGPVEVTSDTPEYCQKLLNRANELMRLASMPIPRNVVDLTSEGQKMCDHGQTRPGIMRLRSALLLMEKRNGPAYR